MINAAEHEKAVNFLNDAWSQVQAGNYSAAQDILIEVIGGSSKITASQKKELERISLDPAMEDEGVNLTPSQVYGFFVRARKSFMKPAVMYALCHTAREEEAVRRQALFGMIMDLEALEAFRTQGNILFA